MTIQIQLPFNPQILISILIPKYMVMGSSQLWNQQVSKHLHVNTAIIQSVASDPHGAVKCNHDLHDSSIK